MSTATDPAELIRQLTGDLNGAAPSAPEDDDAWEIVAPEHHAAPWPEMAPEAFHGLAGDVVRLVDPVSEADPVGVLVTFLTFFGNACGREPWFPVGTASHHTNLFTALVGDTSGGRKGTSKEGPARLMEQADPDWSGQRLQGGLSSGEGIIDAIHDPSPLVALGDSKADPGVDDKRLMLMEDELAQGLKAAQRQGSTVSEIIRKAWDSPRTLRTMTKHNPSKATGSHISIVGHITPAELRKLVGETEIANGFANRFSWYRVRRSKFLPDPQQFPEYEAREVASSLRAALEHGRIERVYRRDDRASGLWRELYRDLSTGRPGLSGELTARGPQMVIRHALVYALLDRSTTVRVEHLTAAVAVWEYAQASVISIFGDLTGDAVADRIMGMLRSNGEMTQTQVSEALGRNQSAARLANAIHILHTSGRIIAKRQKRTGQRGPAPTVYAVAKPRET